MEPKWNAVPPPPLCKRMPSTHRDQAIGPHTVATVANPRCYGKHPIRAIDRAVPRVNKHKVIPKTCARRRRHTQSLAKSLAK